MANDDSELRLTDGVSVEAIKAFLADLKSEFPDTYTDMTTEDACKQLVVPRTQQDNCAYVDLLRKQSSHEHVGKATVFVSHAWRYKIAEVLNVLLEFAEEQRVRKEDSQPVFFWFDLFMNNQNANVTANLPQEWWSTTFKESIANIGRVLLVLMPWRDPVPLTRAWCLWEIFCGISNEGTEVNIRLPNSEEKALEEAIQGEYEAVTDTLVRVQAQRAEAFNPRDKDMIFEAIQEGVGFAALNQAVKDQLRAWCLEKAVAAVEVMQARGEDKTEAFARVCHQVGLVLSEFGGHDRAIASYNAALSILLRTEGEEGKNVAGLYNNLGTAYDGKGDYDKAIQCYEKALAIRVEMLGEEHSSTADTYNNLGNAYHSKGEYDRAIEFFEKALVIRMEVLGEKHLSTADSYLGLGNAYYNKGKYDRAIRFYENALAMKVEALGEKHPSTAGAYGNLGNAYASKGEYDRAIQVYTKGLAVTVEALGEKHPSSAATYNNLGNAHDSKGDYDRAVECYEKALAIRVEALGQKHPSTAETYNNLGIAYQNKGQYDKAIQHYEKGLAIFVETLGNKHPNTATSYLNIGLLHDKRGDKEQACAYVQKGLDGLTTTLGPGHPNTRKAERELGRIRGGAVNGQHASTQHVPASQLQQRTVLAHRNLLLRFISSAVVYQSTAPQRSLLMRFLGALAHAHFDASRPDSQEKQPERSPVSSSRANESGGCCSVL
ncbi:mbre TPR repeat protein [Salpingoeca rosetta]|uniref:Mbre TPR repeat protein n=1 Tax=Salpingoeca rosetta (strain ATCC 50818 / BSB-021) TaxID=946362 RepID=F2U7I4_SALR5|nr:mbre TPR repeat protein [Salpingoeca rosetta]EGD83401.1 mbre TPR repeat protein [Salpingoeca rosetta]|eukprot:XP_004994905.1 mbre TPR repeat protein [Salpingoeca rosetta]